MFGRTDIAFFNVGIRIYPGTGLERIARAGGSLTIPAAGMLGPGVLRFAGPGSRLADRTFSGNGKAP